jgi:drug/metabolite transporter (DMT)-like permease
LVFSEHFTFQSLIGLVLILISVLLVILSDQQKKKKLTTQKVPINHN